MFLSSVGRSVMFYIRLGLGLYGCMLDGSLGPSVFVCVVGLMSLIREMYSVISGAGAFQLCVRNDLKMSYVWPETFTGIRYGLYSSVYMRGEVLHGRCVRAPLIRCLLSVCLCVGVSLSGFDVVTFVSRLV